MNAIRQQKIIFSGHVQGVGFRATARNIAVKIGLKGTVRNKGDGTVEAIVQGSAEKIEEFVNALKKTFGEKKIQSINVEEMQVKSLDDHFIILS